MIIRSHKNAGFSFSEILIVMLILSILSGLAIFSYSEFRSYLRVRSAAQEIVSTLSAARSMAINQNGYFRVGFNMDTGSIWVDEVDSYGRLSQPQVIHPHFINEQVKIVAIKVEDNFFLNGIGYIQFYPTATAQNSTIYLRKSNAPDVDENYYTIKIFPGTGKAKIYPNQKR